jgi:ABC-2 type transport system permease protein
MASNSEFQEVGNQGWLQGFGNLFRKENYLWWGTSRWWTQFLVWLVIANGILFLVIGVAPKMENSAGSASNTQTAQTTTQTGADNGPLDIYGLTVFLKMAGITVAIGVVILGQGTLIDEKQSGTAAWVLSKPISRTSFILSKVISHSLGILVTMAVVQGGIAYLIIYLITGSALPVLLFAGAIGMLFLTLLFWLTLTILLSTLSNARGLVIGVPLILLLGSTLFVEILPWIGDIMPWNLTTTVSATRPAMAVALVTGQPLPTLMPVFASLAWCIFFTIVAIWRLQKEEF